MMGGVEEGKKGEVEDACNSRGVEDAGAKYAVRRIPDDVWGILADFLPQEDTTSLSSVCCWLRKTILCNTAVVELLRTPTAFPAALFASLQQLSAATSVDYAAVLPTFLACPQLRELRLLCTSEEKVGAIFDALPLFPRLQSVSLRFATMNGRLGKLLASCSALQHVWLSERPMAFLTGDSDASAFLLELSALPSLRRLFGVVLRRPADVRTLCACLSKWTQLEELTLVRTLGRSAAAAGALDGIAAAACASCRRLRCLSLVCYDCQDVEVMSGEDVHAIGRMAALRQLSLSGGISCLAPLHSLTKLERLCLLSVRTGKESASQLPSLVARLPLTCLALQVAPLSVELLLRLAAAICAHRTLTDVKIANLHFRPTAKESEQIGSALADAFCRSSVRRWQLKLSFSLPAFMRTWDGCTPAAAVRQLVVRTSCRAGEGELAELPLRCIRSCSSLRLVELHSAAVDVHKIVAAVKEEPLIPTRLILPLPRTPDGLMDRSFDKQAGLLEAAGVLLD